MFEIVTYTYASVCWFIGRVNSIEKQTFKSVTDPGTFVSGALAGALGRCASLPFDKGGAKGVSQTIARRMPQFGCLMMFYCPVAAHLLPGLEKKPRSKMATTFLIGACAGFNMRLVCNPISRVADECLRTQKSPQDIIRILKNKTILQFWYTGPNLFASALYFGTLFTVFEGLRRYNERNFLPIRHNGPVETDAASGGAESGQQEALRPRKGPAVVDRNYNMYNYVSQSAANAVIGGTAAAIATTVCYPYSAHRYLQTVIHNSAVCRGLLPTLLKEVPMMTVFFGTFTLLEPFLSPRHGVRAGFGY